jgi:hypothetical protein
VKGDGKENGADTYETRSSAFGNSNPTYITETGVLIYISGCIASHAFSPRNESIPW